MDITIIIALVSFIGALVFGGGLAVYYFAGGQPAGAVSGRNADGKMVKSSFVREQSAAEFESLKKISKKSRKKNKPTLEEKFFHAGMFSEADRREYKRMQVVAPIISVPVCAFLGAQMSVSYMAFGTLLGLLVGLQAPVSILDRRIMRRSDDIMFYLPLVIEQIVIGVSSSLDVGPCLQRVVQMADERDSHNAVTELIKHAQLMMKSGVSMDEALTEIGKLSGHTELKHAFMSLAQVARHGGEITRQLQELADSVASQRETKIEAKIKKLELEATGPVGLVFVGFLIILLIGFGSQMLKAFQ